MPLESIINFRLRLIHSCNRLNSTNMNTRLLKICLCILLCISCKNRSEQSFNLSDAVYSNSVILMNQIEPLKRLNSLAIIDENRFVLCSENQVYLYENGVQKQKIGRCGKASNEYVYPMIVRVTAKRIYVWCAMTLRFLVFSFDGNYMDCYKYDSAISDFNCLDDKIIIYATGTKKENTIEVYDMQTRCVLNSFANTSKEHKALLSMFSVAPLMCNDVGCYFSPKDKLEIYSLDMAENEVTSVSQKARTESFRVAPASGRNTGYIDDNSFVVALIGGKDSMKMITSEGRYKANGNMKDKSERFYSIYSLKDGVIDYQRSITAESLGSPSLFSIYNGRLYYIFNNVFGDEDHFELRQVEV